MASIAAAGAAAAAIGMWYSQRRQPTVSEFTEPPTNWGEAMLRLHEVVRISWKEALSKLGVWRLDHLLAIRHLSNKDMSAEIAEDAARCGTLVEVRHRPHVNPPRPLGTSQLKSARPRSERLPLTRAPFRRHHRTATSGSRSWTPSHSPPDTTEPCAAREISSRSSRSSTRRARTFS